MGDGGVWAGVGLGERAPEKAGEKVLLGFCEDHVCQWRESTAIGFIYSLIYLLSIMKLELELSDD